MERRTLGGTGMSVSSTCLGTMMFGMMGNTDHDESVRMIHTALDAGVNFVDTADVYSDGRVRADRGEGAEGPARRRRARHQVRHADQPRPEPHGWLAALDRAGGRGQPPPARGRPHRPLPAPPLRPHDRPRGDAGGAHRPGAGGQDPGVRLLDLRPRAHRRGPLDLRAVRAPAVPHRAAPLLDPLPRDRGRRAAGGPALRHGRAQLRPAQRRLAVGSGRRRRAATGRRRRRRRSTSRSPATRPSSRPPRR